MTTPAYAEEAVLGGILVRNENFHEAGQWLTEEHFTSAFRKRLWAAIRERILAGEPADAVTMPEALPDDAEAIWDLIRSCTSSRTVGVYVEIVRKNWRLRQSATIAASLMSAARGGQDAVDEAISALLRLNATVTEHEFTGKQAMLMAWNKAQEAYENGGRLPGITTGLKALDDILGGWHDSDLTIIGARPAMGKEQPNSSLVLLEDGRWKRMGDMRVGDALASVDGEPSRVTGVFPQGVKDVYEFTFSDGRTARAGIDHLWEVTYRDWDAPRVLTTAEIIEKLKRTRYQNRLAVRLISGDFGVRGGLPLDPWLLGFLLGDGNFTCVTPRFSTADVAVLDRVAGLLPDGLRISQCGKYDYRVSGAKGKKNWLKVALDGMGLWGKYSHEKRIPDDYLRASRAERLELLRGLIDSDGWVESFNCIRFAASSEDFAKDVQALARSLGALCSMARKTTTHMDSYVLTIRGSGQTDFASLTRKAERIREPKHKLQLTIRSVRPVGIEECTCIRVSHPTSLYVTDNYVVTHNTALLLNFAEAAAGSGVPCGLVSAEQPVEQIGVRRLAMASGVSATAIRSGRIEDEAWSRMASGVAARKDAPIWIHDRSAVTLDELVATARKWKHAHNIGALFIDYAQRITVPGVDRTTEVSIVARGLKNLARDLGIPVVSLAQVIKGVDSREDKRPNQGDLANSDELTREADQIIMLYRDEVYSVDSPDKGVAELLIEKNRHGPTGFKRVAFIAETMTFADLAEGRWAEAA